MDTNDSSTHQPMRPLGYWRSAAIFCFLVLLLAATASISMFEQFSAQLRDLQQKVQKTAQLQYVAVLLDDKQAPALLPDSAEHGAQQLRFCRPKP